MTHATENPSTDRNHYSYALYEKDDVTNRFDSSRFSGAVGRYIAEHQLSFLLNHSEPLPGLKILDVGAGTGRIALELAGRGAVVLAADASSKMLAILKEKAFLQGIPVKTSRIDAHHLPFPDRSFDMVISFRMIMHVVDWRRSLSELCRVSAGQVALDFPPRSGFAGLAPLIHPLIRPFNSNHQSYKVFSIAEVTTALQAEGFAVEAVDRHLVLPFGLHRLRQIPQLHAFYRDLPEESRPARYLRSAGNRDRTPRRTSADDTSEHSGGRSKRRQIAPHPDDRSATGLPHSGHAVQCP